MKIGDSDFDEADEVVTNWFQRHQAVAAMVRPDNNVFGVAGDANQLDALLREWTDRLKMPRRI